MNPFRIKWLREKIEELVKETNGNRQEAYILLIGERLLNLSDELHDVRKLLEQTNRRLLEINKDLVNEPQ